MLFKRPLVLHPYFLGIYSVLDAFIPFASYMSIYKLLPPFFIISIPIFLLNLFVHSIVKDKVKSGIITTIILVPTLFYCKIQLLFKNISRILERAHYIFLIVGSLVVFLIFLVTKTKRKLLNLNQYLNILVICYLLYGSTMILLTTKFYDNSLEEKIYNQKFDKWRFSSTELENLPDIYYLVFDSYTSSASLKNYWNYDNTDFTNRLTSMGFYIAEESRSFFDGGTLVSTVSTLNMDNASDFASKPEEINLKLVDENLVVKFLQSKGYEIINFSPLIIGKIPRFYRHVYNYYTNDDRYYYIKKILNNIVMFQIAMHLRSAYVYKENLKIFSLLKKIPQDRHNRPRFVYAHIMMPHAPYCFDRNGRFIPWFKKSSFDKQAYLDQLIFTNQIIVDVVNTILSKSRKPPVIILQGDHGFRFLEDKDSKAESFTILNAYYLPNGGNRLLYSQISPFNSFRIIFNHYFGANYKLLPDVCTLTETNRR